MVPWGWAQQVSGLAPSARVLVGKPRVLVPQNLVTKQLSMPGTKSKITQGSRIEIGRSSATKDLLEKAQDSR